MDNLELQRELRRKQELLNELEACLLRIARLQPEYAPVVPRPPYSTDAATFRAIHGFPLTEAAFDQLSSNREMTVKQLGAALNTSIASVRRALEHLQKKNLVCSFRKPGAVAYFKIQETNNVR